MARVRVSIIFETGARIGPGKAQLLASIRDTGSISAAARDMGMSYKRAWLLLGPWLRSFGRNHVDRTTRDAAPRFECAKTNSGSRGRLNEENTLSSRLEPNTVLAQPVAHHSRAKAPISRALRALCVDV
jgi:hypothetical protein